VFFFSQQVVAGEVGSSTMPHKVNPIDFENSEGNLGVANSLLHHFSEKLPVSRFQRDLSDSTTLRNLGPAFAHCVLGYNSTRKGLGRSVPCQATMQKDLANNWSVLTEAVQTVMRTHGQDKAYEQMK
jgi:adenylosuccinate lyase